MTETDSIPRIKLQDLFVTLREFEHDEVRSLEDLRLKICANRKKSPSADRYWATARDNAIELQRLGFIIATPFPKDRRAYDSMRHNRLKITEVGRHMLRLFNIDRSEAYDDLFRKMYAAHRYLQTIVKALIRGPLRIPVITSAKEHVSVRYSTAAALIDDVSRREFDTDSLCRNLERRLHRDLSADETAQIREGVWRLGQDWALAATVEDPPAFAKKFLQKLNDVVLPSVLRSEGLPFDFKTHERLWSFGREWRLWETTARHPDWELRIVFRTASIHLSAGGDIVEELTFDSGLEKTRVRFLEKLFSAYQKLQQRGHSTFAIVDELRAVFCYENACQESVFDRLVSEYYVGSEEYELNMEIYRRSGQHDRPIRIGNRNIGLLRVIKRS
jgi:hypothetical protein